MVYYRTYLIILGDIFFNFTSKEIGDMSLNDAPNGFCFIRDTFGTDPWHGFVFVLTLTRHLNSIQIIS